MKKILVLIIGAVFLFGAAREDLNKKLDELIATVMQLKKQTQSQEERIKKLEKALKIQKMTIAKNIQNEKNSAVMRNCKGIKVEEFYDEYVDNMIPYYNLKYRLKNTYPEKIVFIQGYVFAEDSDGVKILQDFVKRDVSLSSKESILIKKRHLLNNDLEKYLKDEDVKKLRIYFKPVKIKFADGNVLECN